MKLPAEGVTRLAFPGSLCYCLCVGYSVFGIGVDRRNALKRLFHQEKGALKNAQKVCLYSENALTRVQAVSILHYLTARALFALHLQLL